MACVFVTSATPRCPSFDARGDRVSRRARMYACTHTTRDIAMCVATGCINDVSLKRTETRRDRGVVALGVARGVARGGARRAMANGARAIAAGGRRVDVDDESRRRASR